MNVKLNPAKPVAEESIPEPQVADAQATLDVQANAAQQLAEQENTTPEQNTEQPEESVTATQEEVVKEPVNVDGIEAFKGREKVPSDWCISEEDGQVVFSNNVTHRRIEGITIEQFNTLLKG